MTDLLRPFVDRGPPSFSALLPLDPHQARHLPQAAASNRSTWSFFSREKEDVIAVSRDVGIAGPDRALVVNELHRLRNASGDARRRRLASLTGILTLCIAAGTAYFATAACITLVQLGNTDDLVRWSYATAQVVTFIASVAVLLAILLWLRYTRRPTPSTTLVFAAGITLFLLHLFFAALAFILVYVWTDRASNRCAWGIDLVWTWGRAGEVCVDGAGSTASWGVAAAVRCIVTVVVGTLWLHLLRRFIRSLAVAAIVDPAREPIGEVRALLDRHSASIVALDPSAWRGRAGEVEEKGLPAMPERRRELVEPESTTASGAAKSWFASAVDWLFGRSAPPYEAEDEDEEKQALTANALHPAYVAVDLPTKPLPSRPELPQSTFRELFDGPMPAGNWRAYDGSSDGSDDEEDDDPPPPPVPKMATFVRMGDGRLVRKLSTIVSFGSREASATSDLTVGRPPGAWREV